MKELSYRSKSENSVDGRQIHVRMSYMVQGGNGFLLMTAVLHYTNFWPVYSLHKFNQIIIY